jgi:hypothetical protein
MNIRWAAQLIKISEVGKKAFYDGLSQKCNPYSGKDNLSRQRGRAWNEGYLYGRDCWLRLPEKNGQLGDFK